MKHSALVLMLGCLVFADMAAAQQVEARKDTSLFRLPAVTVTAIRSPLRLLDVPLAVSIIPKQDFESANGHRIDEALRNVPGVLAQSRYGGSDVRIVIRGFGARGAGDRSNAGTTRGVRILQDGIPETEPDGRTALDLIDLAATQSVEIVRSNASAMWGNAAGGLINFSSFPDRVSRNISTEYTTGGFGLVRQVVQGGTDIGSGQFFATFVNTQLDGWRAHSGAERKLANLGVNAVLGEDTRLRVHAVAADNSFDIPGPLTLAQLESDPRAANTTYEARRERRRNRIGRLGIELDHDLGANSGVSGMLFVNPKYLQRSERGTFRDFTRYHIGGNAMYRLDHALTGNIKGRLVAGVDEAYQDGAILFYGLTPQGERATDLRDNKREGANNFGVFAQEVLTLGQRFDLTLGARYDNITYYADSYIKPQINDQKSFERISPKLGLVYRLSDQHSVYANLGGGVEAPAGNETDPAGTFGQDTVRAINPLLDPIRSTTLELGTRHIRDVGDGFVRSLYYDVTVYRTDVRNEIVPYRGGRFYFTAARAERRGAEVALRATTAPGVALSTSFTLADNRYREYVVDSVHYGKAGANADFSDNKVVGVPDRFFTVGAEYTPAFFDVISLEAELQNVGEFFADDANTTRVPGYSLLNAGVALRRPVRLGDFGLRASLRAENLADKAYVASAFLNPDIVGGVPVAFEPGMPRHVVATFSLSWF